MSLPQLPDASEVNPVEVVRSRWARFRPQMIILGIDLVAVVAAMTMSGSRPIDYELLSGALLLFNMLLWGLYQTRMSLHILDDLPRVVAASITAGAIGAALFALVQRTALSAADQFFLAVLVVAVVLGRTFSYWLIRWRRRAGQLCQRTVILGAGKVGRDLGRYMEADGSYGCELLGYVDSDPALSVAELPAPVLGPSELMAEIVRDERVDRVLIAFLAIREADLVPIVQTCDRADVDIYIVPRLFEMTVHFSDSDEIDGIPLHHLHRGPFRSPTWWLKRLLDMTVSGLALLLLSPLLGVLALTNRIVDGPGIIFKQNRVGIDGVEFEVLKFRSMRPATETESATNWNIKNDDRLSWFGKFLRRSSLDELPQLWNILRGDMSLVGPRPERPHFVEQFSSEFKRYDARHRVPCGLTGWAQIHGLRGDTSIPERVRYDNYYIQNWSLWLDVKIILRTLTAFMKGSG